MAQQTNFLVFQCYGNEANFQECLFALLSLSRLYVPETPANLEIWIYTDNPEWFRNFRGCNLPVFLRPTDSSNIRQWKGTIDFVHRVKLEMLIDFTHKRLGNILYADTDVVFTHRLEPLFEQISKGNLFMHLCEGIVSDNGNPLFRKLNYFLQDHIKMQVNGKPIQDAFMWNAGALGFNTKYRYLMLDALNFTDLEYPKFPKHIMEQFACSVYFQNETEVKTAAPFITHYWNLKELREVLASFFQYYKNRIWEDLVALSSPIQVPALMQEKINFLENLTLFEKMIKRKWQPATYEWKLVERQTFG